MPSLTLPIQVVLGPRPSRLALQTLLFPPLPRLLEGAGRFSTEKTRWLLPKGRNARAELESIAAPWQKLFHVEQSLTDADAAILVGTGRVAPIESQKAPRRQAVRRHRSKS